MTHVSAAATAVDVAVEVAVEERDVVAVLVTDDVAVAD